MTECLQFFEGALFQFRSKEYRSLIQTEVTHHQGFKSFLNHFQDWFSLIGLPSGQRSETETGSTVGTGATYPSSASCWTRGSSENVRRAGKAAKSKRCWSHSIIFRTCWKQNLPILRWQIELRIFLFRNVCAYYICSRIDLCGQIKI